MTRGEEPATGIRTVGHFAVWDQDVVAAMRVLGSLLRIPEALARVACDEFNDRIPGAST